MCNMILFLEEMCMYLLISIPKCLQRSSAGQAPLHWARQVRTIGEQDWQLHRETLSSKQKKAKQNLNHIWFINGEGGDRATA